LERFSQVSQSTHLSDGKLPGGRRAIWSFDLLDRAGMWLSAACALHCLTTAVVVVALASFGGALLDPHIHEFGLMLAMVLGAVALGSGVMRHGYMLPFAVGSFGLGMMAGALLLPHGDGELLATLAGVMTLALGHDLNGRARCPSVA
jgi:MerC mercury resistance protein